MPVGFHLHHGSDSKGSSNPSTVNRYATSGGNSAGYSAANRPASGTRTSGVTAEQLQRFDALLHRAENRECFDCGAKQPRWASTNLGVFFCLRCAGVHRSMGTHISKVKSTNMDAWEESMMQVMEHIGNARGRVLYEFNMPANARVTSSTATAVVERAVRAKYEKKTYFNPRFDELYAEFMATPLDGQVSTAVGVHQVSGTTAQGIAPLPNAAAPPRRASPAQPSPQPPLDELWGAPVSSPTADHVGNTNVTVNKNNVTSVAELFAGSYASGAGGRPQSNTAWGSGPSPVNNYNASTRATGSPSPYASPSSATNSDWFDSNFGGSNGNPQGSGAPSPSTPHSPGNAMASRSNTNDLFQGSGGTPTSGRNGGSKDEILSLFASAPLAGAGGQSSGAQSNANGGHSMAWQPQTVKPYYYPS